MEPPFRASLIVFFDDPGPLPAPWNMAIDEALLERGGLPILRFYRWQRPTVSFGCLQSFREVSERFPDRELIRRVTGGGAVEHGDGGETATYSLSVPRVGGLLAALGERPAEAFRRVHLLLAQAIAAQNITVALHEGGSTAAPGGACFRDPPVPGDLVLAGDGRKIAGAAQRRTRSGMLHQGSIRVPGGLAVPRLAEDFASALTGERMGQLKISSWDARRADELVRTKYSQPAWTERR